MIRHALRRGAEPAVELSLLLQLKQVLAQVHGGRGHHLGFRRPQQLRVLLAQHVRTSWIDSQDLLARLRVRVQRLDVVARQMLCQRDVAGFNRRHAAAVLLGTAQRHAVLREHFHRVLTHLRVVVVHKAGDKQHRLARIARRGGLLVIPRFETLPVKLGQLLALVYAQHRLHHGARQRLPIGPVGEPRRQPRHLSQHLRPREQPVPQRDAALLLTHGVGAHQQAREIHLELVSVVGGIRTLHVTDLALIAGVDDAIGLARGNLAHVAVVRVNELEQFRKGRAQVEAEPAAMTDLEHTFDFLVQGGLVPITGGVGIVGESGGGSAFDSGHGWIQVGRRARRRPR